MAKDARYDTYLVDDARLIVSAYGSVSRIVRTSIDRVREKGMKVGLLRPITLFPFPTRRCWSCRAASRSSSWWSSTPARWWKTSGSRSRGRTGRFLRQSPGSIPSPAQLEELIEERYKRIGAP